MSQKIEGAPFASLLTRRERFYANPGSRMHNDYEIQIDKKGHKTLKKVGEHDIYEEIQSFLEETKIENILARAAAGDLNALNQRTGLYIDVTDSPKTLAEAQNAILKLGNYFDSLPADIRAKFDNSKEKFVQEYGSEEWLNNMGFKVSEAAKTENIDFVPETSEGTEILTPKGGNE